MVPRIFHPVLACLLIVVTGTLSVPQTGAAQGDAPGRLLVYLEVPRESAAPTTLELASVLVVTGERQIRLDPLVTALDSEELRDTQILLAEGDVPAGGIERLVLVLSSVTTRVGTAPVSPEIRGDGYSLDINDQVESGGGTAVFLRWQPAEESGQAQPYQPFLQVLGNRVPPLGSLALVTSRGTGNLVAVERKTGRVVNMVRLGEDPRDIVYLQGQQKIHVALAGEDALAVVDALSLRVERKIPLRFGDEPDRLALSADESDIYVLNPGSRTLAVLGTWSLQERYRVALGEGPRSLAVDPESGYVYVACEGVGEVQVVNPATGTIVTVLTPTATPLEVVFDHFTRQLFVSSAFQRRIFAYDLREGRDLGGQSICGSAVSLAYNPRLQHLFAAVPDCREIAVVRPAVGLEFAALPMPAEPDRLAFDANHRQLLVVFGSTGELALCNPQRGTVDHLVRVGDEPYAVVAP